MKRETTIAPSVTLMTYAARAKIGYLAALNRVLRGEVEGWQDTRGRWRVADEEVRRLGMRRARAVRG